MCTLQIESSANVERCHRQGNLSLELAHVQTNDVDRLSQSLPTDLPKSIKAITGAWGHGWVLTDQTSAGLVLRGLLAHVRVPGSHHSTLNCGK